MHRETRHYMSEAAAKLAADAFVKQFGGFPYEGVAKVYPNNVKASAYPWVVDMHHWGSN